MIKMKLQGVNVKKIPKAKKKKVLATLRDMEDNRKKGSFQIIKELQEALKYYKEEYQKNSKLEQQFFAELKLAKENKFKLIGAISALKKILGEK